MKDMRDFIATCEEKGLLKRITAEVDTHLELSHIAKLNEEAHGPACCLKIAKATHHRLLPVWPPPFNGLPSSWERMKTQALPTFTGPGLKKQKSPFHRYMLTNQKPLAKKIL